MHAHRIVPISMDLPAIRLLIERAVDECDRQYCQAAPSEPTPSTELETHQESYDIHHRNRKCFCAYAADISV